MRALKAKYVDDDAISAFSAVFQNISGKHRDLLVKKGFAADLAAIEGWSAQLYSGSAADHDALARSAQPDLSNLKDKVNALIENTEQEDSKEPQFRSALADIATLVDYLLRFIQPPVTTSTEGDKVMKLVKPLDDGKSIEIGLNESRRAEVAQALSTVLASTYSLYVKSLFYHWNVTGPQFHSLHELFEQHYENLHSAGDKIAERIRALGHFTPGTLKSFQEFSVINDDAELPRDANAMLANLRDAHELCAAEARSVMKKAEEAGDEVTADMMIGRMEFHDQAIWMLSASQS